MRKSVVLTSFIILVGSITLLAIIFPNSSRFCFSKGDCGIAINLKYKHDSLWHIALAETGFNQIPFTNPSQSGSKLSGYNFLLDFLMFCLMKIGISPWFSFFKLLPLIFIVLYPLLIVNYCNKTKKAESQRNAILFFCYFGSSLGFALSLYHGQSLNNSSLWQFPSAEVLQSGTILHNLQYAYSILVLLGILPLILKKEKNSLKDYLILLVSSFIATGLKLYAGMTIGCLVFFKVIYDFIHVRRVDLSKVRQLAMVILGCALSVLVFYNPFELTRTGFIFVIDPFAFIHQMIENPFLFYSRNLTNARYYLYAQSGFSRKLIMIEIYSIFLFLIYNLGTRMVLFFYLALNCLKKKMTDEIFSLFCTFFVSFIFVILFVQRGDWFNTMQFLFYGVFLMNFLAGLALEKFTRNKNIISFFLLATVTVLTLLGNVDLLSYYKKSDLKYTLIPDIQVRALNFLRKQPYGDVFTPTIWGELDIPSISGKPSFLNDTEQLFITGIDYSERKGILKNLEKIKIGNIGAKYYLIDTNRDGEKLFLQKIENDKSFRLIYHEQNIFIFEKRSLDKK